MKPNTKFLLLICCFCICNFYNTYAKSVDIAKSKLVAGNFYKKQTNYNNFNLHLIHTGKTVDSITAFYVYNVLGNKGFVIVSADDVTKPILGYATTGQFYIANAPKQVVKWIELYAEQISYAKKNKLAQSAAIKSEWEQYINPPVYNVTLDGSNKIAPLLSTNWDQEPYYNDSCPQNSVTGCVATTMAQIMKYWSYPPKGKNTTPSYYSSTIQYTVKPVNLDSANYSWNKMPYELNKSNVELAKLMYHCGASVKMDYSPTGSGAWVITADNPVCAQSSFSKYFSYDSASMQGLERKNFTNANWTSTIKNEISNGRPVQYAGFGLFGGHTWVCDGYDDNDLFHMNWGWGGVDDGYYLLSYLIPDPVPIGYFNAFQQALIGITPPCNNVDLRITNQNVSTVNPVIGNSIHTFFTLWNVGKVASNNVSITKIFLSKSNVLDTSVAYLLAQTNVNSVSAYSHIDSIKTIITIPTTITAGKYYLFFYADANNSLNECIEENNTAYVELDILANQCSIPANDNCAGAILLNYGKDSCSNFIYALSCGATPSGISYNDKTNDDDDVFFKFIPTESNATITVKSDSGYNAVFQVLQSPCDTFLYPVYSTLWYLPSCINQTNEGGIEKQEYKSLIPYKPYYIRVWHSKAGSGNGGFFLCVFGKKCQLLKAPVSQQPGDTSLTGQTITTTIPILTWTTDTASYYKIKILAEPYYSSSLVLDIPYYYSSNNTFQVPKGILKHNKRYCWIVESLSDINATCSNSSKKLYFTVDTTLCPKPDTQANNIIFSSIQPTQVTLKWTKGNSSRTNVNGNTINSFRPPLYGIENAANNYLSVFWGYDQVVYNGTADSVVVKGLQPNSNYCFRLFAANCKGTSSIYDTSLSQNNPRCVQTCDYPKQPIITSSKGSFSLCKGDTITLTAQSANCYNCKYTWNTGDTGTTIKVYNNNNSNGYNVTVNNNCATATANAWLIIEDSLKPYIGGSDRICKGSSCQLYVPNINSSQVSYLWSTGSYYYSMNDAPTVSTTYTVKTTNSCGSFISPPYTVIVDTLIKLKDSIKGNSPVLYNKSYSFTIDTVKSAYSYEWKTMSGRGGVVNSSTSYTNTTDILWQPKSYTIDSVMVRAFNSCGASNLLYKSIVLPPCIPPQTPTITSGTGEFNTCSFGNGLPLTANVPNCLGCTYSWLPYNYYGTGANITAIPQHTTTYTVTVSNGCLPNTSASQIVTVFQGGLSPALRLMQTCSDSVIIINAQSENAANKSVYSWAMLNNGIWENIVMPDTTKNLILKQPILNGSQIRCVLKSSFTCGLNDTAMAAITLNCIGNYSDSLKISPNPNNGNFTIYSKLNSAKKLSFEVYNSIGKSIYKSQPMFTYGTTNFPVKIPQISSGVYFLVVWIDNEKSILSFIVSH